MQKKPVGAKAYTLNHSDGSVWAKGYKLADAEVGYWQWFRKDGSRMRSGHFDGGKQVGTWTTYDRSGKVYKVTEMKPQPRRRSRANA